jgi:predicted O-linked N-acetylglucosamine transferase (SPINDLY family)
MDYFLSSDMMEPPGSETCYTERLVRLPHLGMWYRSDAPPSYRLTRDALGLRSDIPVYWSGQALYKYLPQFDALFPRIASAVGNCQFVFIAFARSRAVTDAFHDRLRGAFAAAGMNADKYCVFLPPMSQDRFVAAVGLADVVLDTPGWSGGKSTLDCLAQDPAIVTLPGRFMRGRHTAAILHRVGCPSTIAGSEDEYVSIAARLGVDPAWRAQVRQAVHHGKGRAFMDSDYISGLQTFLQRATAAAISEPHQRP